MASDSEHLTGKRILYTLIMLVALEAQFLVRFALRWLLFEIIIIQACRKSVKYNKRSKDLGALLDSCS